MPTTVSIYFPIAALENQGENTLCVIVPNKDVGCRVRFHVNEIEVSGDLKTFEYGSLVAGARAWLEQQLTVNDVTRS
jgi:hypothetical protein